MTNFTLLALYLSTISSQCVLMQGMFTTSDIMVTATYLKQIT